MVDEAKSSSSCDESIFVSTEDDYCQRYAFCDLYVRKGSFLILKVPIFKVGIACLVVK